MSESDYGYRAIRHFGAWVVFAVVGGLIALAAYRANPSQPVGMDTALTTLMHQPYGIWLLGIIALGLIAFGFYSMLGALWFRLKKQASG